MRLSVVLAAALGGAALLAGCGPSCQSSCSRIFDPSQCDIRIPGEAWQEVRDDCISKCEDALNQPGEIAGYDPYEVNTSGTSVVLENEKQAALWMECVENTSCQDIDDGYCAPILF